jgi:hypothetical protein
MSKHEGVSIESMQNETENKDTRKNEKWIGHQWTVDNFRQY